MPPQNTPIPSPEIPTSDQKTGETVKIPLEIKPEASPAPISPEAPRTETYQDQATTTQPIHPDPAPIVEPVDIKPTPELEAEEQKEADKSVDIDKAWVEAADNIIEKDKDKPYEEEEDSEKLNINYQKKAFGKDIAKDTE